MHDPSVLVLSIRRPIPRRSPLHDVRDSARPRWEWWSPFATVAGRGLYFPSLVDVWHDEPDGRDSGEVCGYPYGRELLAHLRHLRITVPPVRGIRRRLLTRCEWCRQGASRRKGPVNVSHSWDRDGSPWWRSERGLYHQTCSAVASAHRTCVCDEPLVLSPRGGGPCAACGHYRIGDVIRGEAGRLAIRLYAGIPEGGTPDEPTRRKARALWALERQERQQRERSEG